MPVSLPDIPVIVLDNDGVLWLSPDGDMQSLGRKNAGPVLRDLVIACNAPFIFDRLKIEFHPVFDVLELFAFVHPGVFCVPTPNGLAEAVGLPTAKAATDQALGLVAVAEKLLQTLQTFSPEEQNRCVYIAQAMAASAPIWNWAPFVLNALGVKMPNMLAPFIREELSVWRQLPEWEDKPPRPPSSQKSISNNEARQQLNSLVDTVIGGTRGRKAEPRPEQADYASALTAAFQPPEKRDAPHWVLAEAGTGVGKTLGYLAPSLAWAAKNDGQVWISTYTRHLQNQLQGDLRRIFTGDQANRAVVRKGRENYLCLLNIDENMNAFVTGDWQMRIGLGLMLRWITATRDGDLTGGDLPGWMPVLVGTKPTLQMADRRGECIHQACPHYSRCFIERGIRDSRDATIIVANHALTLAQDFEGTNGGEDNDDERKTLPTRLVFDEGHHLFEAADGAFSVAFSGHETAELKRWLISDHALKRFRRRGLAQRLIALVGDANPLVEHIQVIHRAAEFLPEPGWLDRIAKAMPKNAAEEFLFAVRNHVVAHTDMPNSPYDIEAHTDPLSLELLAQVDVIASAIRHLYDTVFALMNELVTLADEDSEELYSKRAIASILRSLQQRCIDPLMAWQGLIADLTGVTDAKFVDWLAVRRFDGRDTDIGLYRHYVDPMEPFTVSMTRHAHGVAITSATLKSTQTDNDQSWAQAEARTGGAHIRKTGNVPLRAQIPSPFNYGEQTRVILVNDVDAQNAVELAGAFNKLFQASGGGGLGLFTAIRRLRAVHPYLQKSLQARDIPLYAQHVDGLNTATLVDIFRAEEDACLLGTDALRDGVDVPGRALRLVVYDKIPWQRPSILHRARREFFGKREYDMYLTSIRLRQSFGRLVRSATDQGVFVLLESSLPSALYRAFPYGVSIDKMSLAEAAESIQEFLNPMSPAMLPALEKTT